MSKTLREQRAAIWSQMEDVYARSNGGVMDVSDHTTYTNLNAKLEELDGAIAIAERHAATEARMSELRAAPVTVETRTGTVEISGDAYAKAFTSFLRSGITGLSPEERGLFETRTQTVGSDVDGGYTVPKEFQARLVEVIKANNSILGLANVLTTDNGREITWPTNDDTMNEGGLLAEGAPVTEQGTTFGARKIKAHMFSSYLVKFSLQLLRDSAIDVEGLVARKLGQRLGRSFSRYTAIGTGVDQPEGIFTGAPVRVTVDGIEDVNYDALVDLQHSIDPAVRADARYIFSDDTLKSFRKLRDNEGRLLWVPSTTAGAPDTFAGKPYTVLTHAPALAAGNKAVLFGNVADAYVVRLVGSPSVLRLNERFAENLQVGMFAFQAMDAKMDETSAIGALKIAA